MREQYMMEQWPGGDLGLEPKLVVIGGASLDTLHFAGHTVRSAGGAGLYTSLAAQRTGTRVTMVGPRPSPMPAELVEAAGKIDWRGAEVAPDCLPSFEIAHLGDGRTELRSLHWRAEADLSPENLPEDLPDGLVYCIPLTDPRLQLEFLRLFRARGRPVAGGTHGGAVDEHPDVVRQVIATTDIFFCNEAEALGLFGSLDNAHTAPGHLLFVTRGARGVRVIQGQRQTDLPGVLVRELDPTGAGDTFCGTVLAELLRGAHPIQAARRGCVAAAEMVTRPGPEALLQPPPPPGVALDARVGLDHGRIDRMAAQLAELSELRPFDFTGPRFPAEGASPSDHAGTLDFFFAATLQQFGFWTSSEDRYQEPMIATLDSQDLKGSDYLWAAYKRWLTEDPAGLTPAGHQCLDLEALHHHCRCDAGHNPLPATHLRLEQARAYGHDMATLGLTPQGLLDQANASPRPLSTLLCLLDHIGGYGEDPLRKKSTLLALILRQRPEAFLRAQALDEAPPIVDYHIQRGCLRMGLVQIHDNALRQRLEERRILEEDDEWAVRDATYRAMERLQSSSGRSMGTVDLFFFQNRRRCPEMTEPDCDVCPVQPVCARERALFQPVHRTAFY